MAVYQGIGFPFSKGADGIPHKAVDEEVVRDSIRQLLGTAKGERVMRPAVGSRIYSLLFETNDDALAEIARAEIRGLISRYETRAMITDVRTSRVSDNNGEYAVIEVDYVIPALRAKGTVTTQLSRE